MLSQGRLAAGLALVGLALAAGPAAAQSAPAAAPASEFDRFRAAAGDDRVRVIVGLRTPFTPQGALSPGARTAQQDGIDRETVAIRRALRGTGHRVVHTYETVPYIALELSRAALARLEGSRLAASLDEDSLSRPTLASSTPIVEATEARAVGRDGRNKVVAVLDTGVQKTHPFLQHNASTSKVVSEACYSDGDCPGGTSESTAAGSGVPCTYAQDDCQHGTHVAGIAAGKGGPFSGVAREARLLSINVFSRFDGPSNCLPGQATCALSFDSDQLKGLERVFQLRNTLSIASANMSLGGGQFSTACNSDPLKPAIDNLRTARIATVIASGNDGFTNGVNAPGCISTAVTVGATNDSDAVASFSNSSSLVDFFAPGVSITSSVPTGAGPGGGDFDVFDGTSMATPHVAGAWAIARQVNPNATVTTIENAFRDTGKPVTDTLASPQITRDRIRVFSAAANLGHTGLRVPANLANLVGGGIVSDGVGLARRTQANSNPTTPPVSTNFTLSGMPTGARVRRVYLVWQTLGGPDNTAVFKGVSRIGTLVGGSGQFTCWNQTNSGGAYRTYMATIPVAQVPGNGVYSISGVGGTAAGVAGLPDGQGASLIVIYDRPASTGNQRAYLRFGAMTARPNGLAMSHTFSGLSVPAGTTARQLRVGIGDGESFADPAMRFNNTAISAANFWSGKEGTYWDDDVLGVSAAMLPTGTTSRTNSQAATDECLTWGYAALTYRTP
jgi:subtilisin family serine protease